MFSNKHIALDDLIDLSHQQLLQILERETDINEPDLKYIPSNIKYPLDGKACLSAWREYQISKNITNVISILTQNERVTDNLVAKEIAKWLVFLEKRVSVFEPNIMTIAKFKLMLKGGRIDNPKENILNKIVRDFTVRFANCASIDSAVELYNFVELLPTPTIVSLMDKQGVKLNGMFDSSFNTCIISGARGGKPVLIKVLGYMLSKETVPEIVAVSSLQLNNPPKGIVPVEVVSVQSESEEVKNETRGPYVCLVMPHYPRSLANLLNLLRQEDVYAGGKQIIEALEYIHQLGFVHMDVKPANIFIDMDGNWVLGDFGSFVQKGANIISCTQCFLTKNVMSTPSKVCYDYFMLGVTLVSVLSDLQSLLVFDFIDLNKLNKKVSSLSFEPLRVLIRELIRGYLESEIED
ncbi:hypothetical protein ABK040_005171 [Willaertia magna]